MKSFASFLQEGKNDGGDCFVVANNLVLSNYKPIDNTEKNDYKIVHALVYGEGALKGRRFVHAFWIYKNSIVVDQANGNNVIMPKNRYFEKGGIKEKEKGAYFEYTPEQAMEKMMKTGIHGPWDIDLSLEEKFDQASKLGVRLTSKEKKMLLRSDI